jgi:hypothetical protein
MARLDIGTRSPAPERATHRHGTRTLQQRRNLRSTKKKQKANQVYLLPGTDKRPGKLQPKNSEERCNHIYVECQPISGQIHLNQPGQFLVASTSGHRYLMVA